MHPQSDPELKKQCEIKRKSKGAHERRKVPDDVNRRPKIGSQSREKNKEDDSSICASLTSNSTVLETIYTSICSYIYILAFVFPEGNAAYQDPSTGPLELAEV